ncbi:MAG: TonB family protein [Spirochaetia bacterium]
MSAAVQTMNGGQSDSDSRRLLIALLAAVLLHVCFFAALAIIRLAQPPLQLTTLSVDLAPGTLGGMALTAEPAQAGPALRGQPQSQLPAQTRATAPNASTAGSFTIPTPRQGQTESESRPTGPSFRTSGSPTGGQPNFTQSATTPVQEPVFKPSRSQSQASTGSASQGGGGGTAPSRAVGVLVQGGGQAPAKGSLDLGSLDKSLAQGRQAGGQGGTALQGGGGQEGRGGAVGGGQGDFRFRWDQPEAGKARRLLSSQQPRIPAWVSKEGLTLMVLVSFTLTPDGVLSDVNVEASSGYNEVDAAVSEAVRLWRFNADPTSPPIHGRIPYMIRAQ